jgi:hypothetical protein
MRISKEQLGRVIKQEIDKVIKEDVARRGTLQNIMNLLSDFEARIEGLEMTMEKIEDGIIELPDIGHIKE